MLLPLAFVLLHAVLVRALPLPQEQVLLSRGAAAEGFGRSAAVLSDDVVASRSPSFGLSDPVGGAVADSSSGALRVPREGTTAGSALSRFGSRVLEVGQYLVPDLDAAMMWGMAGAAGAAGGASALKRRNLPAAPLVLCPVDGDCCKFSVVPHINPEVGAFLQAGMGAAGAAPFVNMDMTNRQDLTKILECLF